ncbi:MAG: MOSC domain-containing protein [Pyrinomonadaceae bacterium]
MFIGTVQQIWHHPVKSMAGEKLNECTVGPLGIPGDRGWALRDEKSGEITNGKRTPMLMECAAHYQEQPTHGTTASVRISFPDGTQVGSGDSDVNSRLSQVLGKDVTLWPVQPAGNKAHYRRKGPAACTLGRLSRFKAFREALPSLISLTNQEAGVREIFSREAGEPIPNLAVLPPEVLEFTSPLGTYFDAFPINVLTTASLEAMSRFNSTAVWDVRRFRPNFLIETYKEFEGLIEAGWNGRILRVGSVELKCEIPCARCGMTSHAHSGLPKDPSVLRSIVKDANQNLGVYASVAQSGGISIGDPVELV